MAGYFSRTALRISNSQSGRLSLSKPCPRRSFSLSSHASTPSFFRRAGLDTAAEAKQFYKDLLNPAAYSTTESPRISSPCRTASRSAWA